MREDGSRLLAQSSLTSNQFKVLHAIEYLEKPSLRGVRYLTNLQLARVYEAVEMLARKRLVEVTSKELRLINPAHWCERCLVGRNPCKMHKLLRSRSISSIQQQRDQKRNGLREDKAITFSIVQLVEKRLGFSYPAAKWRAETGNAVRLYRLALTLTRNELAAVQAIVDHLEHMIATDKGFSTKVRYPVAVLYSNFAQWHAAVPPKPRQVIEEESLTGYRHRYNLTTKRWELAHVKN